ncbi:MAG: DegV family protein [Monoglobales bacterium]
MAEKIKIVSDTNADVPKEYVEKYNIDLIPSFIIVDDKTYRDYFDINAEQFCKILDNVTEKTELSTAQANIDSFLQCFKKWASEGYKIIVFTISSEGSGTFQTANLAKQYILEEMDADIEIIDSQTYSLVYGHAVIEAAKMAHEGSASMEEIVTRSKEIIASGNAFFAVDTLKFLKKGGRIKPAVAAIGEILNIKPLLNVQDGLINNVEKIRGSKRVVPRIIELLKEENITADCKIFVLDGGSPENTAAMADALKSELGVENPEIAKIGPAILLNTGPGISGVIYFKKS